MDEAVAREAGEIDEHHGPRGDWIDNAMVAGRAAKGYGLKVRPACPDGPSRSARSGVDGYTRSGSGPLTTVDPARPSPANPGAHDRNRPTDRASDRDLRAGHDRRSGRPTLQPGPAPGPAGAAR